MVPGELYWSLAPLALVLALFSSDFFMAYPFHNSPFEEYFPQLRNLRREELGIYRLLRFKEGLTTEERLEFAHQINKISKDIESLTSANQIPPRTRDVYLGEIEFAIEKFEREFPRPEKPSDCLHPKTEMRRRHHADNTAHVVTQCLECGRVLANHKKAEVPSWTKLPVFEEERARREEIEYSRWWESRNVLIKNVVGVDGKYPEFNYEEFSRDYELRNPKPLSPYECPHSLPKLTIRRYSESNVSVVLQCGVCGKHIDNVPKRNVKNLDLLPAFNCTLEEDAWGKVTDWSQRRWDSLKKAKELFEEELLKKIHLGKIAKVDKTTFGSYYESQEWLRTREHILARDGYECQACGKTAECVHHLTYDRLGKENDLDLVSLCNTCHNEVHRYQDGKWFGYRLTPIEIRDLLKT